MAKKANYFIVFAASCSLQLGLDPDIYTATIAPILAVGTLATNHKLITTTIKEAARSPFAKLIKCQVVKGEGTATEETRQIKLLCDIDNIDTAKALLIDKVVKLGYGANKTDWTIKSAE